MLKYGIDKPDLRNPIVIADVTEEFARDDVDVQGVQAGHRGGRRGARDPGAGRGAQPRSFFDKLNDWARGEGAPGLGYIMFEGEGERARRQGADREVHSRPRLSRRCRRRPA